MKTIFDIVMVIIVLGVNGMVWCATLMLFKDAFFPAWFDSGTKSRVISLIFGIVIGCAALLISAITYEGVTCVTQNSCSA